MFKKVRSMLFGYIPRIASALIALMMLSCSMQADLEEFVEEGISLVKITASSYSQGVSPNIVANRSVVSGSEVTVNLEFLNPEGLGLEYEIGYDTNYIDGGEIPTIDPTGPGQNSVSFTFRPSVDAENQTIAFTIAIRSPSLNKIVERGIVSIPCVSDTNTDIRLQAILGSQNVTYTFSGTGPTSAIMDLTMANGITIRPTAEISGQIISYNLTGGSTSDSGNLTSGESLSLTLDTNNVTYTLSIEVTPPCGTSQIYTIKIPRGSFTVIPGGNYSIATFQAAITGQNRITLGGDIKLTDVATTALISNSSEDFYFDGNGHKISGMRMDTLPDNSDIGLVSRNYGIIKNLVLENVNITCTDDVVTTIGGLTGENHGILYRCSVSGAINVISNFQVAGGLVGQEFGDTAECYSTVRIEGNATIGGLAGESYAGSTIQNCYARGFVSSNYVAGGLVGTVYPNGIVRNCYATNASSNWLIGENNSDPPENCFYSPVPTSIPSSWNYSTTLNPAYVWGIGSGINEGYPYLQYFGAQTQLPPP